MERVVVEQELESLRRCLKRVVAKCPADAATLSTNLDMQGIVSLNLSRAVQLCVDIGAHLLAGTGASAPNTMGLTFDMLAQAGVLNADLALSLKKAAGFRNIAVHNYDAINWHIVHSIVKDHVNDFSAFAEIAKLKLNQP